MKITIHVCDLCKDNQPDAKIKYKYRAKKAWISWCGDNGWDKIELCQACLDKIIQADKEGDIDADIFNN